jgi:hypothetical protein
MNPRLGEAIMATLAQACAENEGLKVVTEFPKLHGKLIGVSRDAILEACLNETEPSGQTSAQPIAEFLVYRRCDVSELTAEKIAALKAERDALADFRNKIETFAATLPETIHSEKTLQERLDDTLDDIFKKWQSDQANLSNYARGLFGEGALKEPQRLIEKLFELALKPENRDTTGAMTGLGGLTGAHIGGLSIGSATGAFAGFAVAVVFHAVGTWFELKRAAEKSPFRYLTKLEDQGVVFSVTR